MRFTDFVPPIITKLFNSSVEQKSISHEFFPSGSFPEFLLSGGNDDLSAFEAIRLYTQVFPLNNAISMRSDGFATIQPRLWDTEKREFIQGGEPLELLKIPNADVTQCEFLEQISSYYDITGDSFIVATGRLEKPPLEIAAVPPQSIQFGPTSKKFGILHIPSTINVNNRDSGRTVFTAEEDQKLGLRYINKDRDKEIWHMRAFNPHRGTGIFRGMSRARPIWLELQQYQSGNNNNLSLLKRGTRLSMAWVNKRDQELTDDQWARLQEEAQKYQGDMNAGGTPVLDGVEPMLIQTNNRDMQFKDLQQSMFEKISVQYRIPLSLLISTAMTLNNLQTAMLHFFDGAVLPLTNRIYSEFDRFLLPRYGLENVAFRFNENDIEAVRLRMIETAKQQAEIDVNTTNEIRAIIGYEELDDGNQVFIDLNKVPLGSDVFTADNLTRPGTANKFVELMQEVKDSAGQQKYTDEEIALMVKEYKLNQ